MNTDRELLELAAKAAGLDRRYYEEYLGHWGMIDDDPNSGWWNPLTDDGDALRLAVKLDMFWENLELFDMYFDSRIEDKTEATRRAIVRAAAEIGKNV